MVGNDRCSRSAPSSLLHPGGLLQRPSLLPRSALYCLPVIRY
nr:MAG TPA: conotoxin [Caudoviricetes sp.]